MPFPDAIETILKGADTAVVGHEHRDIMGRNHLHNLPASLVGYFAGKYYHGI
jgi:hypothetical protein